jgi:hypothetical protein
MTTETSKQQALNLFEQTRPEFLANCRWVAKRVALNRLSRQATVDDVHEQVKLPFGVDGRVFGAVFNSKEWEAVGYTKSKRKINHGRPIAIFRLKDGQTIL